MSELNITEKITDSFINVLKKTKLFEKLDTIQFYMGTFVLVTSSIGITSMALHYFNATKIYENIQIQQNNKMEIMDKIDTNNKIEIHNATILKKLSNKINDLEYKIIKLTEIQEIYLIKLNKQNNTSSNSSLVTNSPIEISCSQINMNDEEE